MDNRKTILPHWKNLNLEDIEGEIWNSVIEWEEYYMVSNKGRIKSIQRTIQSDSRTSYVRKQLILKQLPTDGRGYLRANFTRESKTIMRYVHRVVAIQFKPNPFKKRTVNHLDGDTQNNEDWNLAWATHGENHEHSYRELGRKHSMKGLTGYLNKKSKEILCVTTGKKYGSLSEAGRELKIPFQNISKVCKGKRPSAHGLIFQYVKK